MAIDDDKSRDSKASLSTDVIRAAPPSPPRVIRDKGIANSLGSIPIAELWPLITGKPCPIDANGKLVSAVGLGDDGGGHHSGKHKAYCASINGAALVANLGSASTSQCVNLGDIDSGSEYYERIGTQVRCHHLNMRFSIKWSYNSQTNQIVEATQLPPKVRLVLCWDKLAGVNYTGTDIRQWSDVGDTDPCISGASLMQSLAQGTVGAGVAARYNSTLPYNYNTHGTRYKILRDEVIQSDRTTLNPQASINGTNVLHAFNHTFEWNVPLHGEMVTWVADTGSSQSKNELCFWAVMDAPITAALWTVSLGGFYNLQFDDVST